MNSKQTIITIKILLIITIFFFSGCGTDSKNELVIYSARNEHLIKPVFDVYTKETGIKIKFVTDKEGPLLQRLKAEGSNTPADILITVDAGNLWHAANENLLFPVESEILNKNIPVHLRDPENMWFGFSLRVRTIVYNTDKIDPTELSTYEDLADNKWFKRLGLRTSKKVYNQSLVAMMISEYGIQQTEKIVEGWVRNLAADVYMDDTRLLEAMAAGQCDVGIVNTYYFGRLLREKPELPLAIFWANQATGGVHVNVSGAGLTRYSKNKDEATKFLEWLSGQTAQKIFAEVNLEYSANPSVEIDSFVKSWGGFEQSKINLSRAGEFQQQAVKLMDRAGYK
ncbi:MAG: extracellular solute-binding protein [Ignavibacterium sp.]|nr:extracellular solute-binding protein [Ignavibacterium sp.]